MIREELSVFPEDCRDIPAEILHKLLEPYLPQVHKLREPVKMSEVQAAHFEQSSRMPWGKHARELVKDVPIDYLIWIAEHDDEFVIALREYLRSDKIQEEIRKAESL